MTYDDELYKKYKYYGFNENVTTLQLIKPIYNLPTNTIENKIQYFNYCKFEGFYLIKFEPHFLNELKETMIYYGKDYTSLKDKLFILCYNFHFGYPNYHGYQDYEKVISEYCSVYDAFQKNKFIQRLPELMIYQDMLCIKSTIIRLSKSEYKLIEKFLLKQLKLENVINIEHYPKKGFLRRI